MSEQDQGGGWGRPPPTTLPGSPSWATSPYDPHAQPPAFGQPPGQAPFTTPAPQPGPSPYAIVPYQQQQQHPGYGQQQPYPQHHGVRYGAPAAYKNIGVLMLISGIKSAIWSLALIGGLAIVCIGFFWLITLAGAVVEIVFGALIMSGKVVTNPRAIAILGLVNAVLCGNIIGVVLEAIALSQMSKPEVEHYIAHGPR